MVYKGSECAIHGVNLLHMLPSFGMLSHLLRLLSPKIRSERRDVCQRSVLAFVDRNLSKNRSLFFSEADYEYSVFHEIYIEICKFILFFRKNEGILDLRWLRDSGTIQGNRAVVYL